MNAPLPCFADDRLRRIVDEIDQESLRAPALAPLDQAIGLISAIAGPHERPLGDSRATARFQIAQAVAYDQGAGKVDAQQLVVADVSDCFRSTYRRTCIQLRHDRSLMDDSVL